MHVAVSVSVVVILLFVTALCVCVAVEVVVDVTVECGVEVLIPDVTGTVVTNTNWSTHIIHDTQTPIR